MLSEDEKIMLNDAVHCSTCLEWHKHCKAECCGVIFISVNPLELQAKGKYVKIRKILLLDNLKYFKLRGIKYNHGILRIEKSLCKPYGDRVVYIRKCNLLDNNYLCEGHPNNKPEICKALTLETASDKNQDIEITPNCLFRFK